MGDGNGRSGECPLLNSGLQNVKSALELLVLSVVGVLEWAENNFGSEPS